MSKAQTQEAKQQGPAKAEVLPLKHKADPDRFRLAEHHRQIHSYLLPVGTNFEDVLTPEFWLPVLRELKPWSRIEVVEEEGKFWAELLVRRVDHRGATVHVLCVHELGGVGAVGKRVGIHGGLEGARAVIKPRLEQTLHDTANHSFVHDRRHGHGLP